MATQEVVRIFQTENARFLKFSEEGEFIVLVTDEKELVFVEIKSLKEKMRYALSALKAGEDCSLLSFFGSEAVRVLKSSSEIEFLLIDQDL